jgi:hypothetical protein
MRPRYSVSDSPTFQPVSKTIDVQYAITRDFSDQQPLDGAPSG